MSENKYLKIMLSIVILGILFTLIHLGYIIYAYPNSSIIRFVSRELWW